MSRATPDDQLKFLLSCVRHSNNGKIDFAEVARECRVVSKGAAAKRYERLLKANGIHPSGGPIDKPSAPVSKQRSRAEIAKAADTKRRKIEGGSHLLNVDEEDEIPLWFKPEAEEHVNIKTELDPGSQSASVWPSSTVPFQPMAFSRQPLPQQLVAGEMCLPNYGSDSHYMVQRFPSSVRHPLFSSAQAEASRSPSNFAALIPSPASPIQLPLPLSLPNAFDGPLSTGASATGCFVKSEYDGSSSMQHASLTPTPTPTPKPDMVPVKDEVQLSPRTVDTFASTSMDKTKARTCHEESSVDTGSPVICNSSHTLTVQGSPRSQIDNSIIIID